MGAQIDAFLELLVKQGGSDLHLVAEQQPRVRINGAIRKLHSRPIETDELTRMLGEILTEEQRRDLEQRHVADFAYEAEGVGRFRVNVYQQSHGPAAAFRSVAMQLRSLRDLGIPETVAALIRQPSGLTLVCGPSGSGKSTTLAAMVDHLNETRRGHIITIEDPIEFRHSYKGCVVTQREVGLHAPTFAEALRDAVHEDPDVILVGEMRDLETMNLALTTAATGVQVLGTLHTNGAVHTVDRVINVFPPARQDFVRSVLADSLRAVVAQQLVPTASGDGLVAVREILVNTAAAASLIRAGKTHQLGSVIQSGRKLGMVSMDAQLIELVQQGKITADQAREYALDKGRVLAPGEKRDVA